MCLFVPDSGPICIEIDVGEMFMNEYLDDVYFKFDKSMAKDHRPIQSNPNYINNHQTIVKISALIHKHAILDKCVSSTFLSYTSTVQCACEQSLLLMTYVKHILVMTVPDTLQTTHKAARKDVVTSSEWSKTYCTSVVFLIIIGFYHPIKHAVKRQRRKVIKLVHTFGNNRNY